MGADGKHLYGTLMGKVDPKGQTAYGYDGAIWRINFDGSDAVQIVPSGATRTPKQITSDPVHGKLYWGDREGLRVMRCNLDGSALESVFEAGDRPADETDQTRWCVGVAVDPARKLIYFGLKGNPDAGQGRICRIGYGLRDGETARTRSDVEVLLENLPEPIDFEIADDYFYWTDRGNLKGGNSVSRIKLDATGGFSGGVELIAQGVKEAIGIAVSGGAGGQLRQKANHDGFQARRHQTPCRADQGR